MALSDVQTERLRTILEAAVDQEHKLSDWEQKFLADHVERFEAHGSGIHVSGKQWEVLDRIFDKVA